MKKLLAVLLALMMMLCCLPALAEEEAPYTAYTHPRLGYTVEYPTEFVVLDADTLPLMLQMVGQMGLEGLDAATIQALEPQITSTDMVMFLDAYTGANMNIAAADVGMAITNELFLAMVMPTMLAQYEASFSNVTFYDKGSIAAFGENNFVQLVLNYDMAGMNNNFAQFFYLDGTVMYTIGYTISSAVDADTLAAMDEVVVHLLSTFATAK